VCASLSLSLSLAGDAASITARAEATAESLRRISEALAARPHASEAMALTVAEKYMEGTYTSREIEIEIEIGVGYMRVHKCVLVFACDGMGRRLIISHMHAGRW
jgi:hypothetical protein